MPEEKEIKEQALFVEWLKENGIYNPMHTHTTMRAMHSVWKKATEPSQNEIKKAINMCKRNIKVEEFAGNIEKLAFWKGRLSGFEGSEIINKQNQKPEQKEYKKYEFCKDIKCPMLLKSMGLIAEYCGVKHGCPRSAKHFHKWLKKNNYEIIKKQTQKPEQKQKEYNKLCLNQNQVDQIKEIKRDFNTRHKWSKQDYSDFYYRDISLFFDIFK